MQLQEKITTMEKTTSSKVSSAVQSAKGAVGLGPGKPPRMVIIGPPGAGEFPVLTLRLGVSHCAELGVGLRESLGSGLGWRTEAWDISSVRA